MKSKRELIKLISFIVYMAAAAAMAELNFPAVISSHMVLQREMPVPIWGTSAPGEKVTVTFRDQTKETVADATGKWLVRLGPLKAGGPDSMTINSKKLEDVLVGEVWVGSGQSNMQGEIIRYIKNDPVLDAAASGAPYPKIRFISWRIGWSIVEQDKFNYLSAQLFYFAIRLQKELDVPIGLIMGAQDGQPSSAFISEEAFRSDKECKALVDTLLSTYSAEKEKAAFDRDYADWEKAVAHAKDTPGFRPPQKPVLNTVKPGESASGKIGVNYEVMIRAFQPFAIRGVLWDQGEAGTGIRDIDQITMMGALIRSWRKDWGLGDFPFIYVQKPNGGGCAWDENNPVNNGAMKFAPLPATVPNDGEYVETHIRIMKHPNTAMAITSDLQIGIHPPNKSGYATRDADVAMSMVYGKKAEYYGPIYQSHSIEGDKILIKFTHVGQGLAVPAGQKLRGFAVAGEDKVFHWADAKIEGDTIVVSSSAVPKPAAVRYAWSGKRAWASLFNKNGLPALSFRTDDWKQ